MDAKYDLCFKYDDNFLVINRQISYRHTVQYCHTVLAVATSTRELLRSPAVTSSTNITNESVQIIPGTDKTKNNLMTLH